MLHVRERVPLRRRLRIEVVQEVVEHEFRIRENLDGVRMLAAREQRRVGDVDREIQREHFARSNRVGRRDHALGRQQVDGADFVVVAEHAPRRARRRARAYRQFVVAGNPRRRRYGVPHRARRPGRDFADFSHGRALHPSDRALEIDRCARGRRHDVGNSTFYRPGDFLRRSSLRRFSRNRALGAFRCGLLSLDRFGSDFAGFGRRFLYFLFGLGQWTDLLNCSIATASSH